MKAIKAFVCKDSYGHMAQRTSGVVAPIMELAQKHLATLVDYPPVQKGSTFDASTMLFLYEGSFIFDSEN